MIEQLFGSKTRVKLLKLFMTNPNRSFYVREITRKIDEQINSVRRELSNLLSIGIISSDSSNNKLYYEVSQDYEHYQALASLFGGKPMKLVEDETSKKKSEDKKPKTKAKTSARVGDDEKALGNVDLVVLGGIFTRDKKAPVDLLVVGDVTPSSLDKYVADLEKTASSEIRYAVFTAGEFAYRRQIKDKFITLMLDSKLTVKVDKQSVLSETSS